MLHFVYQKEEIEAFHKVEALKQSLTRKITPVSTGDEMKLDWFLGGHNLCRKFAQRVVEKISSSDDYDIELSDDIIPYLEDINLEEYKEILAQANWRTFAGGVFDVDKERMEGDWFRACNFVRDFMDRNLNKICRVGIKTDISVLDYLNKIYYKERKTTIEKKAFWRHLAYPHDSSTRNYDKAKMFIDRFYPLSEELLAGNTEIVLDVKEQMLENPEMTNMIELILFGIRKIIPSELIFHSETVFH